MAAGGPKSGFGSLRRLPSGRWQARYTGPDGAEHRGPTTFSETTKPSKKYPQGRSQFAISWLDHERSLIDQGEWTPPAERRAEVKRQAAEARRNTFKAYAAEYLNTRDLRPSTRREYKRILDVTLLPTFGSMPLKSIRLADVKAWHGALSKKSAWSNAAAYRLLRSILNAAEADELIDRSPARVRGASTVKEARRYAPATLDDLELI